MPTLVQHELSAMPVTPMLKNGVAKGLTARTALKEGDVILPAPCLSFSSPEGVREFLNQGGNGALVEGPLLKRSRRSGRSMAPWAQSIRCCWGRHGSCVTSGSRWSSPRLPSSGGPTPAFESGPSEAQPLD